ncbi:MAG: glycerophosphodiester phosphodiesterase [Dehalococcoidia bacterium]
MVESERPWLIVHEAGRSRRRLAAAMQSRADYIEIDVRGDGARLESRHDPLFHPKLPFLTSWYGLPRLHLRSIALEEIRAPGRLFLDFKDGDPAVVERTVALLRANGGLEGAVASGRDWALVDRLGEAAPEVGRYYSVTRRFVSRRSWWRAYERVWRAYEGRMAAGRGGDGVSIHARLATAARLRTVREAGLRALCYKVNDYETGLRLLGDGAGGLISDRIDLIARWRDQLDQRQA